MPALTEICQLRRAGDYTSPRTEGDILPVVYGDMTTGGSGPLWDCPCIDTANFVYAVAGTALLSMANGNIVTVYDKDGQEISGGWTFNQANNYEGRGSIATLTFDEDQETNEPIGVRCKGRGDGAGDLISSPAAIAEDYLTSMAGYAVTALDGPALAQAKNICTMQGYAAAGLLTTDQAHGSNLTTILGDFMGVAQVGPAGLVEISFDTGRGSVSDANVAAIIRAHETEAATVKALLENACNQAAAEYAYNWRAQEYQASDDGSSTKDAASQARWGGRIKQFSWAWVRTNAVAQTLQEVIVQTFARPPRSISVPLDSLRLAPLALGDIVLLSSAWILDAEGLPAKNTLTRVLQINPDLNKRKLTLDLLDTRLLKTIAYPADGTYTASGAIMAGGGRDLTDY